MRYLRILTVGAMAASAAALFAATPASATIVLCGNNLAPPNLSQPCPQGDNVLFNNGTQQGTSVFGHTQGGTLVEFTGNTTANDNIIVANGGQAKITGTLNLTTNAANDTYLLTNFFFDLANDATFNNVEFAVQGGNASTVTITAIDNAGDIFSFANLAVPNGNAFFNLVGIDGQSIKSVNVDFNGSAGIIDASQFRLDEITPVTTAVPEPATWAMLLFGFGAIGSMLRRRKTLDTKRLRLA